MPQTTHRFLCGSSRWAVCILTGKGGLRFPASPETFLSGSGELWFDVVCLLSIRLIVLNLFVFGGGESAQSGLDPARVVSAVDVAEQRRLRLSLGDESF